MVNLDFFYCLQFVLYVRAMANCALILIERLIVIEMLRCKQYSQAGLSNRVPVIQSRIRQDGRDFDEHIAEFIRVSSTRKARTYR